MTVACKQPSCRGECSTPPRADHWRLSDCGLPMGEASCVLRSGLPSLSRVLPSLSHNNPLYSCTQSPYHLAGDPPAHRDGGDALETQRGGLLQVNGVTEACRREGGYYRHALASNLYRCHSVAGREPLTYRLPTAVMEAPCPTDDAWDELSRSVSHPRFAGTTSPQS